MSTNQTMAYISASNVFPDLQNDFSTFKSLLKELSLTDTLFWCARLNLILSTPTDVPSEAKQKFALKQFLTEKEISAVNNFVRMRGETRKTIIFFRGQILELLRWVLLFCKDFPNDGITFEKQDIRKKFAQAALISSDIWAKLVYRFIKSFTIKF